jgi:hypothetical protein
MEEFTFPRVPLNTFSFPHFASPPPRHVAVSVVDTADHHRRILSAVEPQAAGACSDRYTAAAAVGGGGWQRHHGSVRRAVAEDEMDLLWEDFNEELARAAPPPCPLTNTGAPWTATKELAETRRRAVVRRKRTGLLGMLWLLKKLFLAHKSDATTARRRSEE